MLLASTQHCIVHPHVPTRESEREGPERTEANQASLRAAEGSQIRGFARQAASTASTRQSNQKRKPRSIATKVT